tara:strand:+ start:437 stop:1447 length:1011 start_codon:yes stop_codon:yes gene_type:complete
MNTYIKNISTYLPDTIITNADLRLKNPSWDFLNIENKTGVLERRVVETNQTALDLAIRACDALFLNEPEDLSNIDAIFFCTQSPDYIMPSNSHLLHKHLKLDDDVMAFDYNLACSGFVYGLGIAHAFIKANMAKNILLVTSETYSKFINPKDRSAITLFGDGCAATLISATQEDKGIIDLELSTHGKGHGKFCIPAGGMRTPLTEKTKVEITDSSGNIRSQENIHMDGFGVWSFINSVIPKQILNVLSRNEIELKDIDQFIFHQASKMTIDSLVKSLKLDVEKVFLNMGNKGNTVSATIPIALREAEDQRRIKRGDKILLCGFGVGFSYGTLLMDY